MCAGPAAAGAVLARQDKAGTEVKPFVATWPHMPVDFEQAAAMRSLSDRLGSVIWNGLSGAIPKVALVLTSLYVAQRFGPDAFARYSVALSTFALLGTFPGSTMATIASKFVPEFAGGDALVGSGSITLVLVASVLAAILGGTLFVAAPWLALLFELQPPVTGLLRAAAIAVVTTVASGGLVGLLMGAARFRHAAFSNLAGFTAFAVSIVPLCIAIGPAGALIALAALYLAAGAIAIWQTRSYLVSDRAHPQIASRGRAIIGFTAGILIATGLIPPVAWLCNALLARGADALPALARFNVAYTWYLVVSFPPAVLAQVEFVRMSQAKARGDHATLAREFRRFIARNAILMLPITIAGALLAGPLVAVFRVEGLEAERTLQFMMGAAFVASLANPAGLFLGIIDRIWIASGLNLAWALITLAAAWWLHEYGAIGVAIAFVIGYTVHCGVATWVAQRLIVHPATRKSLARVSVR